MPKKRTRIREIQAVAKSNSTSKLKKKIRDLERLLKKPGLQSTKADETERALKALKYQLENAQEERHVKHMAKKYQMVRFFETKKATRRLNQAVKKLQQDGSGDKKAKKELHKCEIDYYYVLTFPLDKKYVSLYPNEDAKLSKDERRAYKKVVEQEIAEGKYPAGLDEDGTSLALKYGKENKARIEVKGGESSRGNLGDVDDEEKVVGGSDDNKDEQGDDGEDDFFD